MTIYYSIEEGINYLPIRKDNSITTGLDLICQSITDLVSEPKKKNCLLGFDGYMGVEWHPIISRLKKIAKQKNLNIEFINMNSYYKSLPEINKIISSYLNLEPDFGYVYKKGFKEFLDLKKIESLKITLLKFKKIPIPDRKKIIICYGCGTVIPQLRKIFDQIFYFDITREQLFNRFEKNPTIFLGSQGDKISTKQFLQKFYYVDSQILDKHKKYVLKYMDWYVDSNNTHKLKLIPRKTYNSLFSELVQKPFLIKMLYYPTSWGGNWLKKIKKLPEKMQNSGQGFLLENENSIKIKFNSLSIEIPFQNFLWKESKRILGEKVIKKCGEKFPFAYWYDDSIKGGPMAIQVHPPGNYLKKKFNELIRQDESYYILQTNPGAKTYLGLKEDADVKELEQKAIESNIKKKSFDYKKFINSIDTTPGDYLLIPAGTIHASGKNQVVVEIDWVVTAYSPGYTFHIYDYLRKDLDGSLRPIHIEHSFNVLKKNRKTKWVLKNLKQKPKLLKSSNEGLEYLLGSRYDMPFEVHRLEFEKEIQVDTKGTLNVLTLVEGESILVQSQENINYQCKLYFPNTLIVPASIGKYIIINLGNKPCKILKALVK